MKSFPLLLVFIITLSVFVTEGVLQFGHNFRSAVASNISVLETRRTAYSRRYVGIHSLGVELAFSKFFHCFAMRRLFGCHHR